MPLRNMTPQLVLGIQKCQLQTKHIIMALLFLASQIENRLSFINIDVSQHTRLWATTYGKKTAWLILFSAYDTVEHKKTLKKQQGVIWFSFLIARTTRPF